MITVATKSGSHYINPTALTFTENYQGHVDIVHVSLVQGAAIMVFLPGEEGLGYGADADYQRWRLSGATVGLNKDGENKQFGIYARLSRSSQEADIIFSLNDYTLRGSYMFNGEPTEESDQYWYIKIGYLTAPVDGKRTLYYDSGELGTRKGESEKSELFELMSDTDPKRVKPKYGFSEIISYGKALFHQVAEFIGGFKIGERTITGVAPDEADATLQEQSNEQVATPRYVQDLGDKRYLNKVSDEAQDVEATVHFLADLSVAGKLTAKTLDVDGAASFKNKVNIDDDLTVGDFLEEGDKTQGARVTKEGVASFAMVKTPTMQVYELTYNRKTAIQGEFVFSDGDTVEAVTYVTSDGTRYTSEQVDRGEFVPYDGLNQNFRYIELKVKQPYEGYTATMKEHDVLYSNINLIGESGESASTGKCFMYIIKNEVSGVKGVIQDTDENGAVTAIYYNVLHYSASQVPSGVNMLPTPYMAITRHGNLTDTTRQDLFIISSEEGRVTYLTGVNRPTVGIENYAQVIGLLPSSLIESFGKDFLNSAQPYYYGRGAIIQDLVLLDYKGEVVKQQNFRGEWSEEDSTSSDNFYRSTEAWYDVVTYQGSTWGCMVAHAEGAPGSIVGEWIQLAAKGDDGDTPTIYSIEPNYTAIHQTKDRRLNTNVLDIAINANGRNGHETIEDQERLEEQDLTVWYSIDGDVNRSKLIIGGAHAIEVEEGGAIIVSEDEDDNNEDNLIITLESESIDISKIDSKINIFLVRGADDNGVGQDEDKLYIPVTKDGEDGGAANFNLIKNSSFDIDSEGVLKDWASYRGVQYPLDLNESNAWGDTYNVVNSTFLKTLISGISPNREYTFSFYVWQHDNKATQIAIEGDIKGLLVKTEDGEVVYRSNSSGQESAEITIVGIKEFYSKTKITFSAESITGELSLRFVCKKEGLIKVCMPKLEEGSIATSYTKAVSELTGPAGEPGKNIYPAGKWKSNVAYRIENNCVPFVEHNGEYYILTSTYSVGEEQAPNLQTHWKRFNYFQYVYAEFLMANGAFFGGANGAVFWDRYLLSQQGQGGESYGDHAGDAFDEAGNLTGTFHPKLLLNFLQGTASLSNLVEPFVEPERSHAIYINPNGGFNVYVDPNIISNDDYSDTFKMKNPLMVLPSLSTLGVNAWDIDGAHITIMFGNGGGKYAALIGGSGTRSASDNEFLLVCADDSCLNTMKRTDKDLYYTDLEGDNIGYGYDNFIFNRGRRGKYIMMSPGSMIRLRPRVVSEGVNTVVYWYVDSDGVDEKGVEVIHTAYSIPETNYNGNYQFKVEYHNDHTKGTPNSVSSQGNYLVYSLKTKLFGAGTSDLVNLTDSQEMAGENHGVCFAVGAYELLPSKIVISAQMSFDGTITYDAFNYRAFDSSRDTDNIN